MTEFHQAIRECPECNKVIVIEVDFDLWEIEVRKAK